MKKVLGILFIVAIVVAISLGCAACLDDGSMNGSGSVYGSGDDSSGNQLPSDNQQSSGNQIEESGNTQQPVEEEITKVYLTINSNKLQITLAKNSSVDALVERLKKGDITYTANDYGGFEKVGGLGFSLPTDDSRITTQPGDVALYLGNQIVLFYGSNTWSYTTLGKIEGYTASQLQSLFGKGSVKVTLSIK